MDLKSIEANVHSMGFSDFHFINNQGKKIPFAVLEKPISECKIAFISSGGFHLKTEEPFDTEAPLGDITFRKIPSNSTIKELSIAHSHYNHKYVLEDLNCALPLEILKQLEEEKSIGKLAEVNYSFCGFILNLEQLRKDLSMKIAHDLKKQQVDAVILAPVWPICNHSVGVMARVLEELGIPTVTISMFTEAVDTVIPPRTILTQFPFGAPLGFPRNKTMQQFILREALGMLKNAKESGTVFEVPYSWVQKL